MASIKKLLFARRSRVSDHPVFVCVECFNKDNALDRLVTCFPYTDRDDWDYLEELDPDSEMGPMGDQLRMEN